MDWRKSFILGLVDLIYLVANQYDLRKSIIIGSVYQVCHNLCPAIII